jgi:valyl-tRNA synthetase
VLGGEQPAARRVARATLLLVLEALLRALHPLMPFITEEIWQRVAPLAERAGPSIMLAAWPQAADYERDVAAETEIKWLTQMVLGVRQIRGEMDISPARKLPLLLLNASANDVQLASSNAALLRRLAGLESVRALPAGEIAPPSASAVIGELTLLVPMAGLVDAAAELERLGKALKKIEQEIARARAKLDNENFVKSAPAAVVTQEQERLVDFQARLAGLQRQLTQVRKLGNP